MKYLLHYLAFVLMVGNASAQSNLPNCSGSYSVSWSNCIGEITYKPGGQVYKGEIQKGSREGQGILTVPDGSKYIGGYKFDQRHGFGIEYSSNGQIQRQGMWDAGFFTESLKNELPKGNFTTSIEYPNGDRYDGEIKDGKRTGKGTYTFFKGAYTKPDVYDGEWVDGKQNGNGVFTYANGEQYIGEFRNGFFSGQGSFTYENGNKYIGEFKDGKRSGQGTFLFLANNPFKGNKYIGQWANNERNGQGTLYSSNGSVLNDGIWGGSSFLYPLKSQQTSASNNDIEKLRAEAEEAKRKQFELEAQLRLAQQPVTQQSNPNNTSSRNLKRIALVIGNANYASAPLKNPLNDAADVSASLRQSGFEVIDQRNATLQEMTRGIREFGDKLLKSDVGLVYYSGHGLEVKGRNYLLPVNASMIREDEIAFQAIDANLILEKMNTAKKSVNILIVDACRDNPFARSFRSVNRGLAQMDAPTGTIVSFSTAPGKTASDGDGRNSPFTKNLVKAMMRADVPIEAMFKEVRKSVVEETKGQQTPWESSSLIGDFYFKASK
jgi:hypothetical protein